jgi:hypothetical protein
VSLKEGKKASTGARICLFKVLLSDLNLFTIRGATTKRNYNMFSG